MSCHCTYKRDKKLEFFFTRDDIVTLYVLEKAPLRKKNEQVHWVGPTGKITLLDKRYTNTVAFSLC